MSYMTYDQDCIISRGLVRQKQKKGWCDEPFQEKTLNQQNMIRMSVEMMYIWYLMCS